MGKIKQGILGGFRGTVGTVVGSSWNGIAYMKGKPQSVKNPKTDAQLQQRGFFRDLIPADNWFLKMLNTFFGSEYVWITNLSLLWSTCFSKQASKMRGAQEIGTWLIYLFFFVIGAPASVGVLIRNAPILLLFCMIIVLVNMLFCFLGGKLFRFDLEEIILASNANIGGPTTAAGMAISQGWVKLIGPCMLVGTFGYVIGTWLGILVGSLLGA